MPLKTTPILTVFCVAAALGFGLPAAAQDASANTPTPRFADAAPPPQSITPVASAAIVLRNKQSVVIQGLKIDADISIELIDCEDVTIIACDLRSIRASGTTRLRIYNSYIHDSENAAVELDACDDVLIQGNRFERIASGVYAHRSTAVQVIGNYCQDVQGPMPRGQLVQFDQVTGPDNLILGNVAVNHHGRSRPEDLINLYKSHGTLDSPIRIEMNHLEGDPTRGSQDMSDSGSGIMLGDGGGSHQVCSNNILVNPGQVGIGVAGGESIVVSHNTIVGERSNTANVGVYTWNQYENQPAGKIVVTHNRVAWVNADGQSNPYWNGGGFTRVVETENRFGPDAVDVSRFHLPAYLPVPPMPHGPSPAYPFALSQ